MSAPMSFRELQELYQHIREEHSPSKMGSGKRIVKYLDPSLDMRDGKCFAVVLRGYGWEQVFFIVNEARDIPESLFERVMAFLDQEEGK